MRATTGLVSGLPPSPAQHDDATDAQGQLPASPHQTFPVPGAPYCYMPEGPAISKQDSMTSCVATSMEQIGRASYDSSAMLSWEQLGTG